MAHLQSIASPKRPNLNILTGLLRYPKSGKLKSSALVVRSICAAYIIAIIPASALSRCPHVVTADL